MTTTERDELIEKSLLKELDDRHEAHVQQLRRDDPQFRQEYDFQETLIQQVRLKRRQELLSMFADFEANPAADTDEVDSTPVIPLSTQSIQGTTTPTPQIISLWQQSWFRIAATVVLAALLGVIAWWQLTRYDPRPIAKNDRDSTNVQMPKDTHRTNSVQSPSLPLPKPQGPVAQGPSNSTRLQGPAQLPYYETDDVRMGFGQNQPATAYRTVLFGIGPQPAYEFLDTLKVYLPTLPKAIPTWSFVYNRMNDTYYLITGKTHYEIVKGLAGKQPLKVVK